MIKRFLHPRFLRRNVVLVIFVLIAYCILSTSSKSQFKVETGLGPNESGRRHANDLSPFKWIENRRKTLLNMINEPDSSRNPFGLFQWARKKTRISEPERNLLLKLNDASLEMKCRYMVDAIYVANEEWSNELIMKYHENEEVNDMLASLLGERFRMFDYCFLSGGLKVKEVLEKDSIILDNKPDSGSPKLFMQRMFPFLQQGNLVWPKMIDLRRKRELEIPSMAEGLSVNFWNNWINFSEGKGIAITFSPGELPLFHKQLKVLNKLNNTLPIQVITPGFEFTEIQVDRMSEYAINTGQDITLIDCSPILLKDFAQTHIKGYANKWLASLFNTFEEVVLLDVDTIPFVTVDKFLEEPQYQSTGMALFKDRTMMDEHTYAYCIDTFLGLEPSHEENKLMGTNLMFESTQKNLPNTEAAAVYQRFFHDSILHHVDSGLVSVNKVKNFSGLLFSFMMNLDSKLRGCVHGDKEFFWLGQLYAGQNYFVYPQDAGVVGLLEDLQMEELSQSSYMICGSQLAHTLYSTAKETHQLAWTNGGLSTCKVSNAAKKDFERLPDYFKARYDSVEKTEQIYAAPLHIQAMIIPDTNKLPWIQLRECGDSAFCASAMEDTKDGRKSFVTLLRFTPHEREFFDAISFAWNGRTFADD